MRVLGQNSIASGLKALFDALFFLAILLGLLTAVLAPFGSDSGPIRFAWEPVAHFEFKTPVTAAGHAVEPAVLRHASGSLQFAKSNQWFQFAGLFFCLSLVGAAIFVLHQLRRIFSTLRDANPFVRANARRIRMIGLAVVASEFARATFLYVESAEIARRWTSRDISFHPSFSLEIGTILSGVLLLVVAEVFRLGARMKEEQDLTV